jgi:hypothetical protein
MDSLRRSLHEWSFLIPAISYAVGKSIAWDVGVRRPFLFLQHSCKHFTPHGLPGHENVN